MKNQISKVTGNILGAVIGGAAVFYLAKKHGGIHHKIALAALTIGGIYVGAVVQAKIKAKRGVPTAAMAKK